MLEQIIIPEFVLFGGILACGIAVLTLFLAGRFAFVQGLTSRLAAIETQIEDKRKILQDIGHKAAETELLQGRTESLEKRLNALQQDLKPVEEKHLKAIIEYEDVKGKLRQTTEEWRQMTEQVQTYKSRVSQIDSLEQEIKDLTERRRQLDENIKSLSNLERKLEQLKQSIDQKITELENLKNELQNTHKASEEANARLQQTINQILQVDKDLQQRKDDLSKLEKVKIDLYARRDSLEQEIKDLTERRRQLDENIKSLSDRERKLEQLKQSIGEKTTELENLKNDLQNVHKASEEARERLQQTDKLIIQAEEDLRRRKDELSKLENVKIDLDARLETLSDKLKNVGRMPPEAFASLDTPVFNEEVKPRDNIQEKDALDALNRLVDYCGFEIPRRLQDAFHTALKTSDISCLTVMAGVSGTGKSAFPKLYAEAIGMHFLPLAVEPRWDSPQDLFGFLNYMENRFEATTLGRALVQFNNSPHAPNKTATMKDRLLLVLLDEMNLARIEYYFSEFLSKLEMRRNANLQREEDYRMVSVEVFAGHTADENSEPIPPIRLFAGRNVLFVGTMNEDESTQSLSDKVIDRANVLYFGRPNKLQDKRQQNTENRKWQSMKAKDWEEWIVDPNNETIPAYEQIDSLINNMNGTLALLGRPFGWRTYKAIKAYIANHPAVRFREDSGLFPLADQVAMRIMPKLRGLDLSEHGEIFTNLGQTLRQISDPDLQQAFAKASQSNQGFFDWRGISWEQ